MKSDEAGRGEMKQHGAQLDAKRERQSSKGKAEKEMKVKGKEMGREWKGRQSRGCLDLNHPTADVRCIDGAAITLKLHSGTMLHHQIIVTCLAHLLQ